jgi:hypothetical protein
VDKHLFLEIVRNGEADSNHADAVLALKNQHPYSQLLQSLSAKLTRDHKHKDEQYSLQMAAVYAADRHVLRDLMNERTESDLAVRPIAIDTKQEANPTQHESGRSLAEDPVIAEIKVDGAVFAEANGVVEMQDHIVKHVAKPFDNAVDGDGRASSADVAETVMSDLRKLHNAKHNFEMMFADQASDSSEPPITPPTPDINSDFTLRRRKKDQLQPNILEEIKITKEVLEPENERQKEQIEIIDHFIKTQPSITNPKERQPAAANDLNSIKPGEFGENIISETLVEILVKQGKKERAIEVLKKLIWKYPQKKAYFASQIEDLRK